VYEWLETEIAEVRNSRGFHVVERGLTPEVRKEVEESPHPVPRSYTEFVLRFGNARLYKTLGHHQISVHAPPTPAQSLNHEPLLAIGSYDAARAYFRQELLHSAGAESPVFEWHAGGLQRIADGFEQWLVNRCRAARRQYSAKRWQEILKGPRPFTEEEQAIVEARKRYQWRLLGVTEGGDLRFEIHNGSPMRLPWLSIGIRRRDGTPYGGVWLDVSNIPPGGTGTVEKDCYKDLVPPTAVEPFELPDPQPEERDRFWEFKPAGE
jgi:hypothetical protein